MNSRRSLLTALLVACGSAVSTAAQAPAPQAPPTIKDYEQKVAALRAEAHAHPDQPQVWGVLTMSEVILLNLRLQAEAGGGAVDPAVLAEKRHAVALRVREEWKAVAPRDPTPYLMEM